MMNTMILKGLVNFQSNGTYTKIKRLPGIPGLPFSEYTYQMCWLVSFQFI